MQSERTTQEAKDKTQTTPADHEDVEAELNMLDMARHLARTRRQDPS